MKTGVLDRMATTGIYLVRGVSRDLQRAARARAVREGTTLRAVLVNALAEYAAGHWTPHADDESRACDPTGARRSADGIGPPGPGPDARRSAR